MAIIIIPQVRLLSSAAEIRERLLQSLTKVPTHVKERLIQLEWRDDYMPTRLLAFMLSLS